MTDHATFIEGDSRLEGGVRASARLRAVAGLSSLNEFGRDRSKTPSSQKRKMSCFFVVVCFGHLGLRFCWELCLMVQSSKI